MRVAAASVVLGIVASTSHAQLPATSTFTITDGHDTVAVETFTRSGTSLVGDLRLGAARQNNHVRYTLALRPDGSSSRVDIRDDAPGFYTGIWAFDAEAMRTARADSANQGATIRLAPPNSYPTIGVSLAMMEQLVRARHPGVGDSAQLGVVNVRNGFRASLTLKRTAADSLLLVCDDCMRAGVREEIHAALSRDGDIVGGSNPRLNWTISRGAARAVAVAASIPRAARAQDTLTRGLAGGTQDTPERTLGAPIAVGSEPFRNIASVRELSDGRLIVVQRGPLPAMMRSMMSAAGGAAGRGGGRGADSAGTPAARPAPRVVMYDAAMRSVTQLGQPGTASGEYMQPDRLVPARADTTYLTELGGSELKVIDPSGKFVATLALPGGAIAVTGGLGVDARGRLIMQTREMVSRETPNGMETGVADSTAIVAVDVATRATMPIAHVRVTSALTVMTADSTRSGAMRVTIKGSPFPVVDDWVMMPDGTLAIIRGADLHIDWIAPDGTTRSTPPIPYTRREVTDSDKVAYTKAQERTASLMPKMPFGNFPMTELPPDSFPRYKPPFAERGAMAASDGTIWIPSRIVAPAGADGWAVIGPDGKLHEIVHLPQGQRVVGFGKGAVYVAMDRSRVARVPLH